MRIGTGGILLPYCAPFKVAELIALLDGALPPDHPYAEVALQPDVATAYGAFVEA